MNNIEIKLVKRDEVYDLRHEILRPHRPYNEIQYDTDLEADTFHVGAYVSDRLVSVASFNREDWPALKIGDTFRLRAMATHPDFRCFGLGRRVVDYGIALLRDKGIQVLWCKGRTKVQRYYERIGFMAWGDVFEYPNLGPHIILYKNI